ncbi:TolC family outer membrane protein [Derxia gummosa]|uniref:TolC family outer membrane protein n=1 Tax=Derxia gummosa DSM 723 TaxID=1121388 RepID=A0A9U5CWQ7_9BURK|nr:TolC family outer membrane protein [Derxia gummosa]
MQSLAGASSSLASALRAIGALLLPVAALLAAAPAGAQSLREFYDSALASDPVYAAARAQAQSVREREPQAFAALLPNLGFTAGIQAYSLDANVRGPSSHSDSTRNWTLQLSQPLFRWQNYVGWQQAKLAVAASEATLLQAQQDLRLRLTRAYLDVLAAEDTVAFVRAKKAAIAEQLASAKRNFEVGTATITDTNEAQARYDLAIAEELGAENDVATRRTALLQVSGRLPGELVPLRAPVTLAAPDPASIDDWVAAAEADNPQVQAAGINAEIAMREIERARAGHLPTVDVVASRNYQSNIQTYAISGIPNTSLRTDSIGLQLSVPLFAGGGTQARVRETVSLDEQARQNTENARRQAAQTARQTYLGVTTGLAQVRALETAEKSSQSALDSNLLGYKVGVRVNIDVLNAQQQLFSTRRDLAKARYDAIYTGLQLKAAAGRLGDDELVATDGLFGR